MTRTRFLEQKFKKMSEDMMMFADRRYGKDRIRLLYVERHDARHQERNGERHEQRQRERHEERHDSRHSSYHVMKEIEVSTRLTLHDPKDFLTGDNSDVIATDSQKNIVYCLAKQHGITTIEDFGLLICGHFLDKYKQVTAARVVIHQKPWQRIKQEEEEHDHAFTETGNALRYCRVEHTRNEAPVVFACIKDMRIIKTTQSGFTGFVRDRYTCLPYTTDRIWCTAVNAEWEYNQGSIANIDYDKTWNEVKKSIVDTFVGPSKGGVYSITVQKTVYDIQKRILETMPEISSVHVSLPNIHAFPVDFSKFNEIDFSDKYMIYQPSDAPSGNISAVLQRGQPSKL